MNHRWGTWVIAAAFFAMPMGVACADPPAVDYTGHYELADAGSDRVFALDIQQTGAKADISFSAGMVDGSGAAPDGNGKGQLKAGALAFIFKDSFDNEGTGLLKPVKGGFRLEITVTKVIEPRPLRFYETVLLKKTANKPSA